MLLAQVVAVVVLMVDLLAQGGIEGMVVLTAPGGIEDIP